MPVRYHLRALVAGLVTPLTERWDGKTVKHSWNAVPQYWEYTYLRSRLLSSLLHTRTRSALSTPSSRTMAFPPSSAPYYVHGSPMYLSIPQIISTTYGSNKYDACRNMQW